MKTPDFAREPVGVRVVGVARALAAPARASADSRLSRMGFIGSRAIGWVWATQASVRLLASAGCRGAARRAVCSAEQEGERAAARIDGVRQRRGARKRRSGAGRWSWSIRLSQRRGAGASNITVSLPGQPAPVTASIRGAFSSARLNAYAWLRAADGWPWVDRHPDDPSVLDLEVVHSRPQARQSRRRPSRSGQASKALQTLSPGPGGRFRRERSPVGGCVAGHGHASGRTIERRQSALHVTSRPAVGHVGAGPRLPVGPAARRRPGGHAGAGATPAAAAPLKNQPVARARFMPRKASMTGVLRRGGR